MKRDKQVWRPWILRLSVGYNNSAYNCKRQSAGKRVFAVRAKPKFDGTNLIIFSEFANCPVLKLLFSFWSNALSGLLFLMRKTVWDVLLAKEVLRGQRHGCKNYRGRNCVH